ncbi:hypothetical protein [Demequina soli]|uniref:hypothetical protein n=1 Tax=Demequina soli TaxID=1638987 RepID=UPI000782BEEE|nr:hypothetical protein [Demequina soli]
MSLSRFDRIAPWSGAIAGVAWVAQDALAQFREDDAPGGGTVAYIADHLATNVAASLCLVVMAIALLFFAATLRTTLRDSEGVVGTFSGVAYGGWLVAVAGAAQMLVWNMSLIHGVPAGADTALHTLDYVAYFAWDAVAIGVAGAFIATGLGIVTGAALPRWFGIVTLVLGVLGALGAAGIPPGGMVSYVLLPFWLVAVSIMMARRQRRSRAGAPAPHHDTATVA